MKNTFATDAPVKTSRIDESDAPTSAAYTQNEVCAAPTLMLFALNAKKNTKAIGARNRTHLSGLAKIATPNEVSILPFASVAAAEPASVVTAME